MEARGELKPGTAREWAHHTPDIKGLPEHVKKKRKKKKHETAAYDHGTKEALAKYALDEHMAYSGPPAFAPPDNTLTVATEASKQIDDRNDLKDAPTGLAILGNKTAAMTPAFIRSIARDGDIEVDHPEFKAKCQSLTGKAHLDEMSPHHLQQVAKMIWSNA
jgi:hypothetical protein